MKKESLKVVNLKLIQNQLKAIINSEEYLNYNDTNKIKYEELIETYKNDLKSLQCDYPNGGCYTYYNKSKSKTYQFLPNPLPKRKVDFMFICKEPSLRIWGKRKEIAEKNVNNGYQNFINVRYFNKKKKTYKIKDIDVLIIGLFSAMKNKKVEPENISIYMTDLSKCAMNTNDADFMDKNDITKHRYFMCNSLLKEFEKKYFTKTNTTYFFMGKHSIFTNYWNLLKKSNKGAYDSKINRFFNDKYEITKTERIPHYSNKFSTPSELIDVLFKDKDVEEEKEKIYKLLPLLYKFYKNNYYFSPENAELLDECIVNIENINKQQISISDTSLLMYLIYEQCFSSRDFLKK